jgi:hypothetical protein
VARLAAYWYVEQLVAARCNHAFVGALLAVQEVDYEPPPGQYSCPLYKTSVRAGILSTTGQSTNYVLSVSLPIKEGTDEDTWVLQGVALLCMLNE